MTATTTGTITSIKNSVAISAGGVDQDLSVRWVSQKSVAAALEIPQIRRCWQKLVYTPADNNHSIERKRRELPPALKSDDPEASRFRGLNPVEHQFRVMEHGANFV